MNKIDGVVNNFVDKSFIVTRVSPVSRAIKTFLTFLLKLYRILEYCDNFIEFQEVSICLREHTNQKNANVQKSMVFVNA